jgi:hypothetical protein
MFRIGLKNTAKYTPTAEYPARYAIVTLSYGSSGAVQKIYLRQGENPDYLMRPGDQINVTINGATYNPATRNAATRFSPYNLTAQGFKDGTSTGGAALSGHPQLTQRGGVFVDYPTQTGAFFQWASTGTGLRRAYHPTSPVADGYTPPPINLFPGANTTANTWWSSLNADNETCPTGYRRPNDGSESGAVVNLTESQQGTNPATATNNNIINSQMRQSLYNKPHTGGSTIHYSGDGSNIVQGFYADGYFDRRPIDNNSTVSGSSATAAYRGMLFFNPTHDSQASLFFPQAGYRDATGGLIDQAETAYYWSSSAEKAGEDDVFSSWHMLFHDIQVYQYRNGRSMAYNIRCVRE